MQNYFTKHLDSLSCTCAQILEGVSSFRYKVPSNKEQQLFDFYMLVSLPLWGIKGDNRTLKVAHRNSEALLTAAEEAQEIITKHLQEQLLRDVLFSITAEFRHIFANNTPQAMLEFAKRNGQEKELKRYVTVYKLRAAGLKDFDDKYEAIRTEYDRDNTRGYSDSHKSMLTAWKGKETEFVKFASKAFTSLSWHVSYGGRPWSSIADGWLKLKSANNYNQRMIWIDHVYDLQHNTDTVFNKIRAYSKEGDFEWIKKALDKKRNARHLFTMINDVSPAVKTFSARIVKAATGETLESWAKNQSSILNSQKQSKSLKQSGNTDKMIWKGGTWTWDDGTWTNGIWENGTWEDGIWENGTWEKGIWENGTWENGTWKSGTWEDGIWKGGDWKRGIWKRGDWEKGIWRGGTWENGHFESGIWEGGFWIHGIWKGGTWEGGIWENGTWEGGTWKGGKIFNPNTGKFEESKVDPATFISEI